MVQVKDVDRKRWPARTHGTVIFRLTVAATMGQQCSFHEKDPIFHSQNSLSKCRAVSSTAITPYRNPDSAAEIREPGGKTAQPFGESGFAQNRVVGRRRAGRGHSVHICPGSSFGFLSYDDPCMSPNAQVVRG